MQKLHRADATFDKAAGQQGAGRERTRFRHIGAIKFERCGGFVTEVCQFRHAGLHAVGHFVLRHPRQRLGITKLIERSLIQGAQCVEHGATVLGTDAGRVLDVQHGVANMSQCDTGIFAGEKTARPHSCEQGLSSGTRFPGRRQDNKTRQVIALAAQAIREPGTKTRLAGDFAAGHDERTRRVMIDRVGVDRLDQGDVVDAFGRVGHQLAHPRPTLAVLVELKHRRGNGQPRLATRHRRDALSFANRFGQVLIVELGQFRFVVPKVKLCRAAVHVQVNNAVGFGSEVRQAGQCRMHSCRVHGVGRSERRRGT